MADKFQGQRKLYGAHQVFKWKGRYWAFSKATGYVTFKKHWDIYWVLQWAPPPDSVIKAFAAAVAGVDKFVRDCTDLSSSDHCAAFVPLFGGLLATLVRQGL